MRNGWTLKEPVKVNVFGSADVETCVCVCSERKNKVASMRRWLRKELSVNDGGVMTDADNTAISTPPCPRVICLL